MIRVFDPNLEWYKSQSLANNLPVRCEYAVQRNCQKYLDCKSLLNEVISKRFNVKNISSVTSYHFRIQNNKEEEISVYKKFDNGYKFTNFCPESMYEKFDLFVTNLIIYNSKPNRTRAVWQHYFKIFNGNKRTFYVPQHYTDCFMYSFIKTKQAVLPKVGSFTKLTLKQMDEIKEYKYKCYECDEIYVPGSISNEGKNELLFNNIFKAEIEENLFILFLRLLVELKKGKGGWIDKSDLHKERLIPSPESYQKLNNLKNFLKPFLNDKDKNYIIENKKGVRKKIEGKYRLSIHPDFINLNRGKLVNHKDAQIRKLAEELPDNNK